MYKVVHELVHDVFVPGTTTLRSSSKLLYHQPFAHTNAFFHSFVPKTCSAWNNLPDYVILMLILCLYLSHPLVIICTV